MKRWVCALLLLLATRTWAGDDEEGSLLVRAVDATGRPIPRATALLAVRTRDVPWPVYSRTVELRDGEARFSGSAVRWLSDLGPLAVEVYRTRDRDGAPLPLAPAFFSGPRPESGTVALRLGPGRRIEGTAVNAAGAPLSLTDVIARPRSEQYSEPPSANSDDFHAQSQVDGAGRFVLEGLDEREFELWVVDRKGGEVVSPEPTYADGGSAGVAIVRDPNPVARVRLLDPDGKPVARTQVRVAPERRHGAHTSSSTFSDANGIARFPGLDRRWTHEIDVYVPPGRDDLASVDVNGWNPSEEAVVTLPAGRRVDGVTVDASDAGTKAWIHYRFLGSSRATAETTDHDGRFQLRGMRTGPIELAATPYFATDPSRSDVPGMTWRQFPGDTNGIRVKVQASKPPPPRRHLSVRVVGPDGTAPARVTLEFGHTSTERTQTALGGKATLDATNEPAFVRAIAAQGPRGEFLPWAPTRVDVPGGSKDVEISMGEGLSIEGRVLDEKHRPMSGMTVVAQDAATFSPHRLTWDRSAPDGAFRLVGLGSEEVDLVVEATVDTPTSAPVRARGGDRGVALTVRKSAPARVRVVDADGRPVGGAEFAVMRHFEMPRGSGATSEVFTETSADGEVDVPPLDPGLHLSLKVEPPKDRDDLSPLEIDPWTPVPGAVTVPRGFAATLKVLDEDGRPVKARVTRVIPHEGPGIDMGGWSHEAGPDEQGIVRIRGLPFGPTKFTASPLEKGDVFPGSSPAVEVNENRRSAELRIPTKGLRMTVRAEGAGAGRVGLLFADRGGDAMPVRRFRFEQDGLAVLEGIARGSYRVLLLREAGATGPVGRAEVAAFAGGEVRVAMVEPVALRVRVKAPPDAKPPTGLVMEGFEVLRELTADADGRLVCDGLPPGRYAVSLFATAGKLRLFGTATVATGTESEIELLEDKD